MDFLKKKANKEDGIFRFDINNSETKKVTNFYKESPFPNYKSDDDKRTILEKGNKNYLTNQFKKFSSFFIILISYSIFMTFFAFFHKFSLIDHKNLILIPLIGQMLHFYLDSQLWKFSEKHIKDNTLIHLKKIIK